MTPSNHVTPATEVLPDDETLRRARRNRVLAAMEEADIDVLVVGREGNARYVTGAPRLWMAGSRPFGPGCVLVRATGAVYMLSTWDEGIPDDIPHENLYGISFNAGNLIKSLQKIEGADTAKTVATDSMSPSSARLLPTAFPSSQLVDGEPLLRRARRVKSPEEIEAIRASVGIAERSLAPAVAALTEGITERELTGIFMESMASAGVTTPATQDVAWITSHTDPWLRTSRDTPVKIGDLVAFEAGVILNGYVGELGRTYVAGSNETIDGALLKRHNDLWDQLLEVCRVGSPVSDLLDVYSKAGVPAPPMPVARGLGLGFDLPLVTAALPATAGEQQMEAGMVLALTAFIWEEGVGAIYGQEPVVVTSNGPELLTTTPFREARSPST
jgi:Xaa-Pro dipeptidase